MTHKKKSSTKVSSILKKISIGLWIISIICILTLLYFIYDTNVVPIKYLIPLTVIFILFMTVHGFFVINKKTRVWFLILIDILAIVFAGTQVFACVKINDTLSFLRKNLGAKYETNIYNVVVNVESKYESIQDLQGSSVLVVQDMDDMTKVVQSLEDKVDVEVEYSEDVVESLLAVSNDLDMVILVNSGNYDAMISTDEDYSSKVKVLDTIEIVTEVVVEDSGVNVAKEPFVLYLSGIDTRSNALPSKSLSDVNIILAVNPKTKNILMIHIPRDYYVQLHGKTGLKDKLTHAGAIGGVELSMSTIEDLLEIEIPYYLRVNFNSVVNLVDAIGGIRIYSDVNYSFTCWTDRSCTFNPGYNYVDGQCALAFARERHAYETGDRHRGENQEQVISLIINKITSSTTLINKYTDILNALNGTFETNLTTDDITSLVKMQLDDMRSWNISTVNVDGTGVMSPTHSYPNQNLYVMNPDQESIEVAIKRLNEILETPDE